ncbi:MAG TPA: dihydrofolate reductase family protein [Actinomycetota bacterium]|nr:dihydrofolate reductase family protein [Actinomycetota bacterium]
MGKVTTELSMSLDGYIAHPDDTIDYLFDWYWSGDVELTTANPELTFNVSKTSYDYIQESWAKVGCLVSGGWLFRIADGWGGRHPVGAPVVVVSHEPEPADWRAEYPDAPFTFVGDVEGAIAKAKEIAGGKNVAVAGPAIVQQVINLGLMNEITVSLVPVLIGEGISFFGDLVTSPVKLSTPTVVEDDGVTHLTYQVQRS